MKEIKKMSFDALVGAMSREAMKEFIAGSGSTMSGSGSGSQNSSGGGGTSIYNNFANAVALGYQTVSSFYTGLQSTNLPGTAMYVEQQSYNSSSGWGTVLNSIKDYNYNNSYNSNNNNSNYGTGWFYSAEGNNKTVDPMAINRLLALVDYNRANNLSPNEGVMDFISYENSAVGRKFNDAKFKFAGILLDEVIVYQNKKSSTGIQSIAFQNGSLVIDTGVAMGSGGVIMGSGSYGGANFGKPVIVTLTDNDDTTMSIAGNSTDFNNAQLSTGKKDDYVFDEKGNFIRMDSEGSGHNIKIFSNGTYLSPSSLNLTNKDNAKAMAKIVAFYAQKLGMSGRFGLASYNGDKDVLAFTSSKDRTIYINTNGGVHKELDNFDNLKNTLLHENLHKKDFAERDINPNKKIDLMSHTNIYLKQMEDLSFAGTTDEFKRGIVGSFVNYLMNMDRLGKSNNEYNPNTVRNKIDEFNALGNGYQIVIPGYGGQAEGSLNPDIYFQGNKFDSQTFKKVII
jgi:Metallopeptidase toxin 2